MMLSKGERVDHRGAMMGYGASWHVEEGDGERLERLPRERK